MNDYDEKPDVRIGDKVRVPNGETGTVGDVFFKDGEWRTVVTFKDDTWLTISPIDIETIR